MRIISKDNESLPNEVLEDYTCEMEIEHIQHKGLLKCSISF